jgi:translation initiation factor eIF-2B subunit delta
MSQSAEEPGTAKANPQSSTSTEPGTGESKANGASKPAAAAKIDGGGGKEEKQLTPKELKLQKAAEKQAKRAAQRGGVGAPAQAADSSSKPQQGGKKEQKAAHGKPSAMKAVASGGVLPSPGMPHRPRRPSIPAAAQEKPVLKAKPAKSQISFVSHLAQPRRLGISGTSKDVHPAVLTLGLQMSRYEVCGSTARVLGMLLAFKTVVQSYTTPPNQHISRHFTPHVLSPQIEFLKSCRPISISMGNAIRYMKEVVAEMSPDTYPDEDEAKNQLVDWIDTFIKEKIQAADALIAETASGKIVDGDTIMVYGKSSVVLKTLLLAKAKGKSFKVIVIDSKPLFEGKNMARDLVTAGFTDIEYTLLNGLSHLKATKAILGAHAMMANGRLFSRCGTALVAMTAKKQDIPVMVCCESIKFSDKAPLDSILHNELADGRDLLPEDADLKGWEGNGNLHCLNLMYDLTPAENVTAIYTEYGVLPPSSVPTVLRLLEDAGKQGL